MPRRLPAYERIFNNPITAGKKTYVQPTGIPDQHITPKVISTKEIGGKPVYVGGGIPFGEVFVNDNTTVTSVSSSGFTKFLHFDTNGHKNNSTPDQANNNITIDIAGVYMVDSCVNIKNSSGNAHTIEVVISKNNNTTIFPNMRRHRTLGTGTDVGAIPVCGHVSLNVGDTLELWITSSSVSARDVTGEDVVLMITQVGG